MVYGTVLRGLEPLPSGEVDDLQTEGIADVKMEDVLPSHSKKRRTRVFLSISSFDSLSPV